MYQYVTIGGAGQLPTEPQDPSLEREITLRQGFLAPPSPLGRPDEVGSVEVVLRTDQITGTHTFRLRQHRASSSLALELTLTQLEQVRALLDQLFDDAAPYRMEEKL